MESIIYLQSYRKYLINKLDFYPVFDWVEKLRKEFYNPKFKTDIIKCDGNFDSICVSNNEVKITDEMYNTPYDKLGKFKIHLFREE